uniref:Uncharacterized protein n=1 Tax=Oryza rufipogon TaxID=4529 RepID=A0A0G2KBR5_ORYRU
MVFPFGVAEC